MNAKNPLIFILGPTATGKSDLALNVAEKIQASILNCDSLQFFKSLEIGTAKPSLADFKRVPHYLFNIVDEGRAFTAGEFRKQALQILQNQLPRSPMLAVGGSGFYVQALDKGMYDLPPIDSRFAEEVRAQLNTRGLKALFEELKNIDPQHASQISEQDNYRITRALIIFRGTGKTPSQHKQAFATQTKRLPWPTFKVGLRVRREDLKKRIELRTREMLNRGLVEEVRRLLAANLEEWPPLKSVGYRETIAYLRGNLNLDILEDSIVRSTMALAKKQMTWFKRDPEIRWFDALSERDEAVHYIESIILDSRKGT